MKGHPQFFRDKALIREDLSVINLGPGIKPNIKLKDTIQFNDKGDVWLVDKLGTVHIIAGSLTLHSYAANHTLTLEDANGIVEMFGAANTVTVPSDSDVNFPLFTEIVVTQYGATALSIAASLGVNIRSKSGMLDLAGQFSAVSLVKRAANEWYLWGDLV